MAAVLLAPNIAVAATYRVTGGTTDADLYGLVDGNNIYLTDADGNITGAGYNSSITEGDTTASVYGFNTNGTQPNSIKITVQDNSGLYRVIGGYSAGGLDVSNVTLDISNSTMSDYVYGAQTSGDASSSSVTLSSGSSAASVYGANVSGNASDVTVSIDASTVTGTLYGAYAGTAVAGSGTTTEDSHNVTVTVSNNSTVGSIHGVHTSTGDISDVVVTVTGSKINSEVYGAYQQSANGNTSDVTGATITIDNSSVGGVAYAIYARGNTATGGEVTVTGGSTVSGSIRGAYNQTGTASGNTVTINGGSTAQSTVYGGAGATGASDNTVIIGGENDSDSTTVNGEIAAGSSTSGTVSGNTLTITGSAINHTGNIYGGVAREGGGDASSNTVTITDSTVLSSVYGGYSQTTTATYPGATDENKVYIKGGSVSGSVYGGLSAGGEAIGNVVEISDGANVSSETDAIYIYGGDSQASGYEVSGNSVTITGSTVKADITGGVNNYGGTVTDNHVIITGSSSSVTGTIYGGNIGSGSGDVTENDVTLNGGSVEGEVYAGHSGGSGDVNKNTVTLNEAEVNATLLSAGYSRSGGASDNIININGGSLSGGLTYAGYSGGNGTVENNVINLNGGTVSGTLYAGFSSSGTVQNNTINLDGKAEGRLSDIDVGDALLYGSNIGVVTGTNGNTLNIKNFSGNIGNIVKFDIINIDLYDIDVANAAYGSGSVIYLTDTAGAGTNLTNSTVNIYNSEITYSDRSVVYTSASSLADAYTIVENNNGAGFMTKTNATITEQLLFVQNPDEYSDPQYAVYELITDEDDGTISYTKTDIDPDSAPPSPSPEPTPTPEPTPDPGPGPAPEPTDEDKAISALAGTAAKLSMYYAQLDDLRKRLGEVRYGAQDGIWARVIYQQDSFSGTSSYGAKQKWYGLNVGVDHIISQDEDKMWLIGANFKYGHSKEKLKRQSGGKGNLNDYGVNVYATYANQYGCYADFVLTFDEYKQKLGVSSDGSSSKGDYSSWGWGASIEVGKMFSFSQNDENWGPWQSHWWVEPQAQLSYYWLDGKDFSMSSGKRVTQDNGQSLVGRLGLVVGKKWSYGGSTKVDKRYVQAYLKGGVKHEFLGKQDIKISGTRYDDRLRGTTGYYGAGVDWNLTRQLKAYAQVERESGGKYKKDIQASVGLKWQF